MGLETQDRRTPHSDFGRSCANCCGSSTQHRRSDRFVFSNQGRQARYPHPRTNSRSSVGVPDCPSATVHALRHSFGAHLRMAGVSLADIADLLGTRTWPRRRSTPRSSRNTCGVMSKLTRVVEADERQQSRRTAGPRPHVRGLLKD